MGKNNPEYVDYLDDEFTLKERRAIKRLMKLADTWPESLTLFSWSSSLTVLRTDDIESGESLRNVPQVTIYGIRNDGGDPE